MKISKFFCILAITGLAAVSAMAADAKQPTAYQSYVTQFAEQEKASEAKPVAEAKPEAAPEVKQEAETQPEAAAEEQTCWCMTALRATGIYFANVFSDLADIVSFEVSAGAPFEADVFATHFCELGWEYTDSYFAGWNYGRQFSAGRREAERIAFLAWSSDKLYVSQCAGWAHDAIVINDAEFNFQRWDKALYRDCDRDFWAIGARAGLFVGVDAEFHPVAVADFCCSLIGLDLTGDNWK